jgi:hypothetical protein
MKDTAEVLDSIFDEEFRQLTELKRMALNPRLVELMRRIVKAVDAAGKSSQEEVIQSTHKISPLRENKIQDTAPVAEKSFRPNGLTAATLEAVKAIRHGITIPMVVDHMLKAGFRFTAANPKTAVAGPINAFVKKKLLRKVHSGIGSDPNIYEFIGQESAGELPLEDGDLS